MQTKIHSKNSLPKLGSYLFNFGLMTGLAVMSFGLISCGGGGSSTTTTIGSTTPTITNIVPVGIVASSVPQALSIAGTNFASGMTVTVIDSLGEGYTVTPAYVTSSKVITTNVTIPSAPTDRYVTVAVKSSTGTTLASAVLGVAGTNKTLLNIQTIFTASCGGCHQGGAAQNYLALNNYGASAANLGDIPSVGCSPRFRVIPGDPRRASSVLIDKIKAPTGIAACSGNGMPGSPTKLLPQDITDIMDWVAGGAN